MKRGAPVLALLLLAPWVGEFLLGNISVRQLPALLILTLLYGCGALLIREVARRTGRGWPTILLLGAAYGVIEAGLVDQSMFNPSFEGWEFQAVTPVPALGISAWYAWTFVIGHSVWSIAVPIALVELLFPERGRTPWLGRTGLALTAVGYLVGCLVVWRYRTAPKGSSHRSANWPVQPVSRLVLIAVAFACRPISQSVGHGWVPRPLLLGLVAFLAMGVYQVRPESWGGLRVRDRMADVAGRAAVLVCAATLMGATARARAGRCGAGDVRLARFRAHPLG